MARKSYRHNTTDFYLFLEISELQQWPDRRMYEQKCYHASACRCAIRIL